jgi:hypothetical protein
VQLFPINTEFSGQIQFPNSQSKQLLSQLKPISSPLISLLFRSKSIQENISKFIPLSQEEQDSHFKNFRISEYSELIFKSFSNPEGRHPELFPIKIDGKQEDSQGSTFEKHLLDSLSEIKTL